MPRHELPAGFLFWMVFFRLACASPVLIAAGVVLYLHFTGESMNTVDEQMLTILSVTHGVFALVGWLACALIPRALLRSIARSESDDDERWEQALRGLRTADLYRLVVLEGPALFGIVICILAVLGGLMTTQPLFWLNGLSSLAMLLYVPLTLPTKAGVELFLQRALRGE